MTPGKVIFSAEEIAAQVNTIADSIKDADDGLARDTPLLFICVLRGAFIFTADLLRALEVRGVKADLDFVGLSSYGAARQSKDRVRVVQDLHSDVARRDIIVVDDILETGRTLDFVKTLLAERGAKRVRTCVLLDKPGCRKTKLEADFVGFEAPKAFVVGYGMDVAGSGRGLPYIGTAPGED